jgi:ABC transporter permease protein
MNRKTYWKDVRKSFSSSKGRVISIASLMALGSFALVGLKVTTPDMQHTATNYFTKHHTADLTLTGSYGLNQSDQDLLNQVSSEANIEYGYFKDVVLKNSFDAFRLYSKPKDISTYEVVKGKLPNKQGEIALSSVYQDKYKIGDKIDFSEKKADNGKDVLKEHSFTITGFVQSSEILSSVDLGPSTAGSGELKGYAVVPESSFDSDVYMIARLAYKDVSTANPYTQDYADKISKHKDELKKLVKDQPAKRLEELKASPQAEINQQTSQLQTAETELNKKVEQSKASGQDKNPLVQEQLTQAQEKVNSIAEPSYDVYTRSEAPWSQGYVSYETNASAFRNLSNIFPVILYFIAALVTFVTMGRFVEEERIKAGTFKALGYQNKDIIRKFLIYGFLTSMIGTTIGVATGHILLPSIIYSGFKKSILIAPIELHFYPFKTVLAIILALLSAVLPAFVVAKRELGEKPAQLLLPKPPTSGSKILLERISPLWKRMSFTQKVTARNIFRYKQRMFMTIFGVCGSIALLFAGLGIRSSIGDLNTRQFPNIIRYDMIVANKNNLNEQEKENLQQLINKNNVKEHLSIHYETLSKDVGSHNDSQDITTLVIQDKDKNTLQNFIKLDDRKTGQKLDLTDKGIIISEKLADLAGVSVGDYLTVQISQDKDIKLKVAGISEMYMGHFIFMNETTYKNAFGEKANQNANILTLKNHSDKNVEKTASQFMKLDSVTGVV